MTPERSERTPAIAPKIRGTDRRSAPWRSPVNGINFPAADQDRNDIKNAAAKTALAVRTVFRALNCKAATSTANNEMIANEIAPVLELMIHSLMKTHSPPKTKPYVTGWLFEGKMPKTNNAKVPRAPIVITPRLRRRSGADSARTSKLLINRSIPSMQQPLKIQYSSI